MLIHKKSCGALIFVYIGNDFSRTREASFKLFPDLNHDEWWEIQRSSALGKTAERYYPDIIPHVDENGDLVDLQPIVKRKHNTECKTKKESRKALRKKMMEERGYDAGSDAVLMRPTGVFDFLDFGADLSAFAKA